MSPSSAWISKIGARLSKLAFVPVVVYCAVLARPALRSHFSNDDPMNIGYAWRRGFGFLLWHCVTFWSTAYRPMGGLFYLSIYRVFGLNPQPYRIAILCFVVANAYLSYRLAERITDSRAVGFLTGVFAGAHGAMVDMYYENDIIYDVLAYFFSMLTLIRYVTVRKQGLLPNRAQSIVIVCLFLAALNSKEISVTVAGFILAYEVLFHGLPSWAGAWAWLKREGRLPLILMLLAVVYTVGKLTGPESLAQIGGYKIHLSPGKYVDSRHHYWYVLFYMLPIESRKIIIAIDATLLVLLLFFQKNPALRWCCFYVLTAALPITFIPQRGGTELYLELFGWALLLSIIFVKLIDALSPALVWTRFQIPRAAVSVVLVTGLAYAYVSETVQTWRDQPGAHLRDQAETWSVLSQLKNLPFRPEPGSRVLFLDDPFKDYRMEFIAELVWDDHSLIVDLAARKPTFPTPAEIAKFDSLLTVESGQVKLVRAQLETPH
jgi:hypothetical protein